MAKSTSFERELPQLAEKLSDAKLRAGTIRSQLDARLSYWHEDGVSIAALARATGLSRETIYKSIERHREQLGS